MKHFLLFALAVSVNAAAPAVYGLYMANEGTVHPPQTQPQHQIAKVDPYTGKVNNIGAPSTGGAVGQATGEAITYKGEAAMYSLHDLYDGTKVNARIEKHSLVDGRLVGIYPLPQIKLVQWTTFGQQMVLHERDTGLFASVLAPTSHNGGDMFDFSLFTINLSKNSTVVEAALGTFYVSPSESAGYSVAHDGNGLMYAQLTDTDGKVILEISCQEGKVLRKIKSHTSVDLVLGADGNNGIYGVTSGYITPGTPTGTFTPGILTLWKLEPQTNAFRMLSTWPELGNKFELNPPAISAMLSNGVEADSAFLVSAVDLSSSDINAVSLITLPLAGNTSSTKATVVKDFCFMHGPGHNYTCPKVISATPFQAQVITV
jgi:hypothetical protein